MGWKQRRWRRELVSQRATGGRVLGAAKESSTTGGMKVQQLPGRAAEPETRKGNRNATPEPPPDNEHGAGRGGAREVAERQDLKTGGGDKGESVNGKGEMRGLSGQAGKESQKEGPLQPGRPQCVGIQAALPAASSGQSQWVPTPRTDEAAWAAAALGFLLVLLTLAVLHTRLYRHWRRPPSLYWHQPEQDHDSVAGGWAARTAHAAPPHPAPLSSVSVPLRGDSPEAEDDGPEEEEAGQPAPGVQPAAQLQRRGV